jgi:hypothetical protein
MGHITCHGSYHFDLREPQRQKGGRPLRIRTEPLAGDRSEDGEDV